MSHLPASHKGSIDRLWGVSSVPPSIQVQPSRGYEASALDYPIDDILRSSGSTSPQFNYRKTPVHKHLVGKYAMRSHRGSLAGYKSTYSRLRPSSSHGSRAGVYDRTYSSPYGVAYRSASANWGASFSAGHGSRRTSTANNGSDYKNLDSCGSTGNIPRSHFDTGMKALMSEAYNRRRAREGAPLPEPLRRRWGHDGSLAGNGVCRDIDRSTQPFHGNRLGVRDNNDDGCDARTFDISGSVRSAYGS
jgi:hypothetical protein